MFNRFRLRRHSFAMHGVTLVELMVTIAVAAIVLSVAVPAFRSLIVSNRLTATTNAFVAALNLARSEAIKRNARVTLCKTADPNAASPTCSASASWNQGAILFVDRGTVGTLESGDTLLRVLGPFADVTITAGANFALGISYLPTGVSQGVKADGSTGLPNDSFNFCASGQGKRITINTTGRPASESLVSC
ncbi:GspH/FimT family pseudopilin [Hydrogenophilus thiooxidans]|uniref:GspH/FimT family pseudopilin n=1 Tax=Hydrogenophilus thiooxidans TaxID=2820326 RepID=UPI001C24F3B8|nr:GspH/FimT family pseudopilin [Hydrogenophilus thiooxidans]